MLRGVEDEDDPEAGCFDNGEFLFKLVRRGTRLKVVDGSDRYFENIDGALLLGVLIISASEVREDVPKEFIVLAPKLRYGVREYRADGSTGATGEIPELRVGGITSNEAL